VHGTANGSDQDEEMTDDIEPENIIFIEPLLADWKREMRRTTRCFRAGLLTTFVGMMLVTTIRLVAILGHSRGWWHRIPQQWEVVLAVAQLLVCFIPPPLVLVAMRKMKTLLKELIQIDDIRVVGPLFEALVTSNNLREDDQDRAIYYALERLLPRMQASDAVLLTAKQRRALYQILVKKSLPMGHRQQAAFRLTILKALEQIGDSAAVPFVEALTKAEAYLDYQIAVREAAQACLPFLRQRAEQAAVGNTLLRASGDPAVDNLLKPATGIPANDAQQLLRVGIEE
jgi:hypothetical protein